MQINRRNFVQSAALLLTSGIPSVGSDTSAANSCVDAAMLNLGVQKQLFFDDLLIESVQDITREFHQPRKYEGNPLIVKDKPWEHVVYFRVSGYSILQDPKDKLFKAWYTDEGYTNEILQKFESWTKDSPVYRTLYAYSEDGIHWHKPPLGIYRENGQETNIDLGDAQSGIGIQSVILDPFESNPSRRFKTLYYRYPGGNYEAGRTEAGYSSDGVHWTQYEQLPSVGKWGPHLGDCIILDFDAQAKLYLLNCRHPDQRGVPEDPRFPKTKSFLQPSYPRDVARMTKRRIYQSESSDFIHWGEPVLILTPDEDDNLDDSFYGMPQFRNGDMRIGLLNVFHEVPNFLDVQLAYSLDGRCWKRVRQPWLTTGPAGSWDQVMVEMNCAPLQVGDELWFYYGGSGFLHHDWHSQPRLEKLDVPEAKDIDGGGYFLGLAKLRLDGYCSLNAGPVREGILVTRPLTSTGSHIVMNAECGPGGYIDVEVFDEGDEIISGYSRKDFDRFTGDAVRHQLSWQSRTVVPPGRFRRLLFYMRNAKVYSLQFLA